MKNLPFEILCFISQYLSDKDLKQLQLVNKEWYEASIDALYCHVVLKQNSQVIAYVRTISNSLKLGICLKTINVLDNFQLNKATKAWDVHDFSNTLINHCPNLRELKCNNPHWILRTRLMLAAYQGKLSNLEQLPTITFSNEKIEPYTCTALLFKNSLTSLQLYDDRDNFVSNYGGFNILRGHLKEFPKLQDLSIIHYSNQPFNYLDSIIDDCPNLTSFNVVLIRNTEAEPARKHDVPGLPRPNVRRLMCSWKEIVADDQLKYIMHKFPNLQFLYLPDGSTDGASYNAMMEFIQYMSTIPEIHMRISITREDLTKYWNEFFKLRNNLLEANISYTFIEDEKPTTMIYDKNLLNIYLPVNDTDTDLPHIMFLKEHGNNIKSLTIEDTFAISKKLDNATVIKNKILNENWIYQTLRACPFLQKLTLKDVQLITSDDDMYQHTELKKLSVYDKEYLTSLKFLRKFSTLVPNLKELYLFTCFEINLKNNYRMIIDMPNISFDLITVEFELIISDIAKHYIKLNTFGKRRYFIADKNEAQELSYKVFQRSKKNFLLTINCQAIKQFKFIRNMFETRDKCTTVLEID